MYKKNKYYYQRYLATFAFFSVFIRLRIYINAVFIAQIHHILTQILYFIGENVNTARKIRLLHIFTMKNLSKNVDYFFSICYNILWLQ